MVGKSIFDLSGKVALITGGGSGLGRIFCEAMAEFGADVACCDINEKTAQGTVELISKFGHRTLVIKADVTLPSEAEYMVDKAVGELGKLDILFNNAGISTAPVKIHEMSVEEWDRVMAVNLRGVFLCMRAVLPVMIKQNKGCIINISSTAALIHNHPDQAPAFANYSASKAGVISLTRQAAMEYVRNGIRVNCIAPGFQRGTNIGSEWRAKLSDEKLKQSEERIASSIPMGRRGEPSELKGLAVYLASGASSYVTGQVFVIDGGRTVC